MSGQPQPDRASSLPADSVYRLHATRLTWVAGRPRAVAPKRAQPALSLVKPRPAGKARIIDEGAKHVLRSDTDKENHDA
jgi:hypothetical protein